MEVKIFCPCGVKYKFDVEPLHGKLPGPVKCPVCGADGTVLGNEVIARSLAATVAAPSAKPTAIPIAIPVASTPAEQPSRSGVMSPTIPRSSKDLQPATAAVPAAAIKVIATPTLAPSVSAPKLSVQAAHSAPAASETAPFPSPVRPACPRQSGAPVGEPSFTRGLIGIAAASFVGLLLWFAITLFLGANFKWFAIGIGALIGWAGHWLAKEKSQNLGIAASIATGLVMITGVLWSARHEAYQAVNETIDEMWKEKVSYAKEAVAASRTDEELKTFLDKNGLGPSTSDVGDDGDDDAPILQVLASASSSIDAKTLADFKKNELPNLRKVAEGKVSKSQFERENRPTLEAAFTVGFVFVRAFKVRMLILIGLAVGAAWKFTAG
jgi:hypothetical protein